MTDEDREIIIRVGDVVERATRIARTYPALFEPVMPRATHELPQAKPRKRAAAAKGGLSLRADWGFAL